MGRSVCRHLLPEKLVDHLLHWPPHVLHVVDVRAQLSPGQVRSRSGHGEVRSGQATVMVRSGQVIQDNIRKRKLSKIRSSQVRSTSSPSPVQAQSNQNIVAILEILNSDQSRLIPSWNEFWS